MVLLKTLTASRRLHKLVAGTESWGSRRTWLLSGYTVRTGQTRAASKSSEPEDSRRIENIFKEFGDQLRKDIYQVADGMKMFHQEVSLLTKEWLERPVFRVHVSRKGQIEMLQTFEKDEDIKKFTILSDSGNNEGYSTGKLELTERETAVFSGYLDTTVPKDGRIRSAGYVAFLSRQRYKSVRIAYDWTDWTHLVLKVRGDGRCYMIVLSCPLRMQVTHNDQYHYPLYTRGGPYWQIVKIPFSHFFFSRRGRIEDYQEIFPKTTCSSFGIVLMDNQDGPFRLEIEYFGLENQQFHREVCPYEMYN